MLTMSATFLCIFTSNKMEACLACRHLVFAVDEFFQVNVPVIYIKINY